MRKFFSTTFFVLSFSLIGFSISINFALADTKVSGIINNDTTWTLSDSPYIITGNILVNEGINLKIEPGVVIKFRKHHVMGQGLYIKIDGTLLAVGEKNNMIKFTAEDPLQNTEFSWGSISFTEKNQSWNEQNNTGSIMEYCIIEYGSNNSYQENQGKGAISINGSSPLLKNNIIKNINGSIKNALSISGDSKIINNDIKEGRIIIFGGSPYFTNNKFSGEEFYIVDGSPTLTNNEIINTTGDVLSGGIRIDRHACPVITFNNIINNNGNGIFFVDFEPLENCALLINNNNIYNNNFSVLLHNTYSKIDLTNNWWGTEKESEIDNIIYDKKDDFILGEVLFEPFLSSPKNGPFFNEDIAGSEDNDINNDKNQVIENVDNDDNLDSGIELINKKVIKEEKSLITKIDNKLSKRISGNILLQVEKNGEGWYVNPDNKKKYYLGRPADAFSIMRNLGLGIKHSELNGYLNSKFPSRLSGKIMLDVEQNGEAYYVNPKDLKGYFLNRPADAFRIMRELGLGITNSDIRKIDVGEIK